jgi:polyisoprenoid-binding protein YceI
VAAATTLCGMTQFLSPVRGEGGQRRPTPQQVEPNRNAGPVLAAGTYRIDPTRTRVRFTIKETFGLMTTRGTFTVRDGTVEVAANPEDSSTTATLDAASFKTDKPKRDKTVVSKSFLHATDHPTITFSTTRLAQENGSWVLHGQLTVRGQASPVALTLTSCAATVDGCRFIATTRVDRYATPVRAARGLIGRHLDVELDVYAVTGR